MDRKNTKSTGGNRNDGDSNETIASSVEDSSIATTPVENEISFGEWLKAKRVSKQINLEEIAAVTKVHISQLRALEENEIESLPAAAFVRGFLVSYCRHLGLNENEVLERYRSSYGSLTPLADVLTPRKTSDSPNKGGPDKVRIVSKPQLTHAPGSKEISRPLLSFLNFRMIALATAAIGLMALIAALISIGSNDKNSAKTIKVRNSEPPVAVINSAPKPSTDKEETTSESSLNAQASDSTNDKPTVAESEKPTAPVIPKISGKVRAIEQNWLSIRSDDSGSKGMLLRSGQVQDFEANRKIDFAFSDAGNVEIFWEGAWYAAPGARGDVLSLSLPSDLDKLKKKVFIAPKVKKPVATDGNGENAATRNTSGITSSVTSPGVVIDLTPASNRPTENTSESEDSE